jgi:hypothetical protein
MNLKIKSLILLLLGLVAFNIPVNAQFTKKAQVGMKFLSNPVSAEAIARGTAAINSTYNSNGIFWNPALTSLIESNYDVSLNHHQWIADISYNAVAASFNAFDFAVITLSGTMVDYGELFTTVRSNNAQGYEETGTFSPAAYSFGLGFAQKVTDRFSYGLNVKYVNQDLGSAWIATAGETMDDVNFNRQLKAYTLEAFAFDIGTYYDFQYKGITFAATLANVSQEKKYENELFPLPFSVNFGATISPLQFLTDQMDGHDIVLMFESHHPRDFGEKLKFGVEYNYSKIVYLRGGYISNLDERKFSAGIGFKQALAGVNLRVDYAFQDSGIFGNLNYFTVGMGI